MNLFDNKNGFTLIELLITLAISSIIISAAVAVFFNFQASSNSIDQRSNLFVNARGAMYFIEENIRLAGFNPKKDISDHMILETATAGELVFSRNDTENLAQNKSIRIGLKKDDDKAGGKADGIADSGVSGLVIDSQNVADDIVAIGFGYGFDNNENGAVDLSANKNILWAVDSDGDGWLDKRLDTDDNGNIDGDDGSPVDMAGPVDISKIRAIKIWLLTRTRYPVKGHTDSVTYKVGAQSCTPDNHFFHVLHTTTIRCRNL